MRPDITSVEPPELIRSGYHVFLNFKPEVITETVKLVQKVGSKINILCGPV